QSPKTVNYALTLAGHIANVGKQSLKDDPQATEMLRQLLRELFKDLSHDTEFMEAIDGISIEQVLEDPGAFLFPPISSRTVEQLENYMQTRKAIDIMA
ncbi:MAG: hypothetical protein P9M03_10470, partial [Candidatus Theseobacter exili]|nr:hypothetical protein [Candidatus Theseobacter exili]